MTHLAFPWRYDGRGGTASVELEPHIRNLIEQVLFTTPGERVNRPDFGSGLMRMPFEPLSSEVAATAQLLVQGSLQQWLGELIEVGGVLVDVDDTRLTVTVAYVIRRTREQQLTQFTREA